MSKLFRCLLAIQAVLSALTGHAQCTTTTLNWDQLDFFPYSGNYPNDGYLTNLSQAQSQRFSFGRQVLTITHNYTAANFLGENITHSGETSSFGNTNTTAVDADVQFLGNGTITLSFRDEVTNLHFSLYDIDRLQRVAFNARNAANVGQNVSLTKIGTGNTLTLTGNGTAAAQVEASGSNIASTANNAAIDVTVAGPVRTLTLTVTNTNTGSGEDGSIWLSDILACADANFPTNYYQVSQPYTGMPSYVLHSFGKSVYAIDPATGRSKFLFDDPLIQYGVASGTNQWFINSMAYDPYNRELYYVFSLTDYESQNRMLRKYNFNTKTITTVVPDLRTLGIAITSVSGVESGGAAFYDGSLYLGIETSNTSRTSGREAVIWRIDFNASGIPTQTSQLFALPIDGTVSGSNRLLHDWGDFVISNGVLYNFDAASAGTATAETDIYHFNMTNGSTVVYPDPTSFVPGQPTVDWNGNLYNMVALYTTSPIVSPQIAPYNAATGTVNSAQQRAITTSPMYTGNPSLGDAAEGFRPLADFGDAPASFDPVALSPAVHEIINTLKLGATTDVEWLKETSANAGGDAGDEDGLPFVRIISTTSGVYYTDVTVTNNTGANATLVGWIDFNANGFFDASEGISYTVPSQAGAQTIQMFWTGIPRTLANNTTTFLRLRLTSAVNGLTTAMSTGYMPDGEVEDYQVLVNSTVLASPSLRFDVNGPVQGKAFINWQMAHTDAGIVYELQKSNDGLHWTRLWQEAGTGAADKKYAYTDHAVVAGANYYRLSYTDPQGAINYSDVKRINQVNGKKVGLYPNPANTHATMTAVASKAEEAIVYLISASGNVVLKQKWNLTTGVNRLDLNTALLPAGFYQVQLATMSGVVQHRLVVYRP